MKEQGKNFMVRWLESGHWTSETFKMALLMGLVVSGLYFGRTELPGLYERWTLERAQNKRIAEISKERDRLFEENKVMVLEAKKERVNQSAEFCKTIATSKQSMIKCLNKIKIEE